MRFWIAVLLLCNPVMWGQKPVSDSLHPYHTAVKRSAMVPGWGQIYNSKLTMHRKNAVWKVPLIYGCLGGMTTLLVLNQKKVNAIKTEYENRIQGGPLDLQWADYDNLALVSLYDQYARNRDLSILGLGAVYLFQIADAAVEAHFLRFDVSKDLTLELNPWHVRSYSGINLSLCFH
ncbi:MAG: hypothetical protein RIQ90_1753 [Bacteroidota bacterium]